MSLFEKQIIAGLALLTEEAADNLHLVKDDIRRCFSSLCCVITFVMITIITHLKLAPKQKLIKLIKANYSG